MEAHGTNGPDILGRLFDEHAIAPPLSARQWCDVPEDIVQGALASSAGQRTVPERVVPWLYRVVRNGAISASRQSVAGGAARSGRPSRHCSGDPLFDATDDLIDAELASRLLADLDGETREVIVGRLSGGLTFEEFAKLQSCSLSTAHRRYQAGLARLHARLEPQWTSTTQTVTRNRPEGSGTTAGGLAAGGPGGLDRYWTPDQAGRNAARVDGRVQSWRLATAALILMAVGLGGMLARETLATAGIGIVAFPRIPDQPVASGRGDRVAGIQGLSVIEPFAPSSYFALTSWLGRNNPDMSSPDVEFEPESRRRSPWIPGIGSRNAGRCNPGTSSAFSISDPSTQH